MAVGADLRERAPDVEALHPPVNSVLAARLCVASVVAAVVPVIVALIRALRDGWLPIGDNAYFSFRARDVLTDHNPLLGTWTSASQSVGVQLNNPGPLLFDWLALPVKIAGRPGVAIGMAALNVVCIVAIAVVAHRRGGPLVATASMMMAAGLAWTMGSSLLIEPWQPHGLLFPFLLFLVLVWSLACGDDACLPWAVLVASFIIETHLSYAVLVPVLGLWGFGALIWAIRRRRRAAPGQWADYSRRLRKVAIATGIVLAICWFQPVIEQFTSDGDGNLSRVSSSASGSSEKIGASFAVRMVATVAALPPWWMRPSFGDSFLPKETTETGAPPEVADLPSVGVALAALASLAVVLALCGAAARRRRDTVSLMAVVTAALAAGAGVVTAASLPLGIFGIAPHQFRWLWPVSVFVLFAVLVAVGRARPSNRMVVGFASAAIVLGLLNLPAFDADVGPSSDGDAIPLVRDLTAQMGALEGRGTLLFDISNLRFAEPYDAPVMDEMVRRGIPFVVTDEGFARQLGPERKYAGRADARLFLEEADGASQPHPGATRVAFATSMTDDEQRELDGLHDQIAGYLQSGLRLNDAGERALREGRLPVLASQRAANTIDIPSLFASREVFHLGHENLIALDATWAQIFDRYVDLQHQRDTHTVALFVAPVNQQP